MYVLYDENKNAIAVFANAQPDLNLIFEPDFTKITKSDEQIKAENEVKKIKFLSIASEQINILQDELDLELAEDVEATAAQIKAWKAYRVKLNKVDTENPIWAEQPKLLHDI